MARIVVSKSHIFPNNLFLNSYVLDKRMPVTAAAMEAILDYAYTGRIKLDSRNAVEVLTAIDYFSMINVLQKCADYVVAHAMTMKNVTKLRLLFVRAGLYEHVESADNFIKILILCPHLLELDWVAY